MEKERNELTPERYNWLFDETLDDETEKKYLDEFWRRQVRESVWSPSA